MVIKQKEQFWRVLGLVYVLLICCVPLVSADNQSIISIETQIEKLQFDDSQEKITINHEFSFSKGADYTQIPKGAVIHHSTSGITRIFDVDGRQLMVADDANSQKIFTTIGYLPATKIYQVPNDSLVIEEEKRTRVLLDDQLILTVIDEGITESASLSKISDINKAESIDGGYIEDAYEHNIDSLGSFVADWDVPSPPPDPTGANTFTYLFNAIGENGAIAQTVIRSGHDRVWTGMAVYGHKDINNYYFTAPITVNPDDEIQGTLGWSASQGCWGIRLWDRTTSQAIANMSVQTTELDTNDVNAFVALEQYNVAGHDDLPGSTIFHNMVLKDTGLNPLTFTWETEIDSTASTLLQGLYVDASSQSRVKLYTNKKYTITPTAGTGGSTSPSSSVSVLSGSDYTVSITPQNPPYMIGNVLVDGESVGAPTSYTFNNIQEDHTIVANFILFFIISPSVGLGGTMIPSSAVSVPNGGSQTFEITPNIGYAVDTVSVDGTSVGSPRNYTFTNVSSAHSISATFKALTTAPVANFTGTPTRGTAPLTVRFTDTSTGNPTGWIWDFGDGNTTNATVQNPVHTYFANGSYSVSLTATNGGGSNTMTKTNFIEATKVRREGIGTFRNGTWSLDFNKNFVWDGPLIDKSYAFGQNGDVPVRGDWNGDDIDEIGVFRNGFWILDYNNNGAFDGTTIDRLYGFGQTGDVPLIGDWNGDGKSEVGIFQNGWWFLDYNGNGAFDGTTIDKMWAFGQTGDVPLIGDWNGDTIDEVGVFRDQFWILDYNNNGAFDGTTIDRLYGFGQTGDVPLNGDWNGDGKSEVGIFQNGWWFLDYNGNGAFDGTTIDRMWAFGQTGDIPLIGDWNGDGKTEVGIFQNGWWIIDYNNNGSFDGTTIDRMVAIGQSGDTPIKGKWS